MASNEVAGRIDSLLVELIALPLSAMEPTCHWKLSGD